METSYKIKRTQKLDKHRRATEDYGSCDFWNKNKQNRERGGIVVLFFVLWDKKRRWQSGWQRRWTVVTEQEGQRRRKDRAGWEGVGGVGGGELWKRGGSKKLEERRQELVLPGPGASFCSQRLQSFQNNGGDRQSRLAKLLCGCSTTHNARSLLLTS